MSRKTILILLAILIVLLGVWVVYESHKSPSAGSGTGQKGILGSLFPFGSSGALPNTATSTGGTTNETGPTGTPQTPSTSNDRLMEIVNNPTAGYTVLPPVPVSVIPKAPVATSTPTASSTAATSTPPAIYPTVRFVESGTGYIYDVGAKGGNPNKVSGTVVARTAQALFGNNGTSVIFRYVDTDNQTISTYLGRIVPSSNGVIPGSVTGNFLTDDISDIVVSADQKEPDAHRSRQGRRPPSARP